MNPSPVARNEVSGFPFKGGIGELDVNLGNTSFANGKGIYIVFPSLLLRTNRVKSLNVLTRISENGSTRKKIDRPVKDGSPKSSCIGPFDPIGTQY